MNEDDEDFEFTFGADEGGFLADVGARLIENELYKGNIAKLAIVLAGLLDDLSPRDEDSEEVEEFKVALLDRVIHGLLYHEVVIVPSEDEINDQVNTFGEWFDKMNRAVADDGDGE